MTANVVLLPILLPLLTGAVAILAGSSLRARQVVHITGLALAFASSLALLAALGEDGHVVVHVGGWAPPVGIVLVADWLSGLMVAIACFLGLVVGIYALREVPETIQRAHFHTLYPILLMGVNGAFLTGDLFNLYVWFEVMLIASFVLLTLAGGRATLEGGFKYVVLNLLSSSLFLAGAGLLYAKVGTLNMADLAVRLADHPDAAVVRSSAVLFLVAFGLKAAIFPLFFWLPASYHTPPAAISALFAGLLTKVGVYALIRAYTLFFAAGFAETRPLLLWLAALTMLTGVLGAAAQHHFRKILSFHIVSQIGYMVLGLALMTPLALAGTVFYLLHHIVVKTTLFLVAGIVARRCHTEELAGLGGLLRSAPLLALLFFIPAFSLGGIPPLSGFWAKFALLLAAFRDQQPELAACALLTGLLTLFSMTKIWAEAFLKKAPADAPPPDAGGSSALLLVPVAALVAVTLGLSFFGAPAFALAERAAAQLLDPRGYIEAVGLTAPPTLPSAATLHDPHP